MWTPFRSGYGRRRRQSHRARCVRLESLETRKLLAADFGDVAPVVSSAPAEVQTVERLEIQSVTLRINGEDQVVVDQDLVALNAGDTVEITNIEYHTGLELDGVLAVESYMHKLPASQAAGELDYADGRFGSGEPIADGPGTHAGVEGSWEVQEGWDRLTLTMVRYFGDSSQLETVFNVTLQVGLPDFAIDPELIDSLMEMDFYVGEAADISGSWFNLGDGRYHNYLELDVANLQTGNVDWVGVLVGNASDDAPVEGVIDNPNPNDPFAEQWIPEVAGEYEILIAVDPELIWNESDETNNRVRFKVNVTERPSDPGPDHIYAVDNRGRIAKYDATTGDVQVIGDSRVKLNDIAESPDGELYGVSKDALYRVDTETGKATKVARLNHRYLSALAFMDDGTLVAGSTKSSHLISINLETGRLSSMGDLDEDDLADISASGNVLTITTKEGDLLQATIENGRVVDVDEIAETKSHLDGLAMSESGQHIAARGTRLWTMAVDGAITELVNLKSHGLSRIMGLASNA